MLCTHFEAAVAYRAAGVSICVSRDLKACMYFGETLVKNHRHYLATGPRENAAEQQ